MPACRRSESIITAMLAGRYPQVRNELQDDVRILIPEFDASPAAAFSRVECKSREQDTTDVSGQIVSATVTVDRSQSG